MSWERPEESCRFCDRRATYRDGMTGDYLCGSLACGDAAWDQELATRPDDSTRAAS